MDKSTKRKIDELMKKQMELEKRRSGERDGDKMLRQERQKAMRRLLEYPRLDGDYVPLDFYRVDGSEETFNWN